MTKVEMEKMQQWLEARADKIEDEEPYAVNQIQGLRDAADEVNSAIADGEYD